MLLHINDFITSTEFDIQDFMVLTLGDNFAHDILCQKLSCFIALNQKLIMEFLVELDNDNHDAPNIIP